METSTFLRTTRLLVGTLSMLTLAAPAYAMKPKPGANGDATARGKAKPDKKKPKKTVEVAQLSSENVASIKKALQSKPIDIRALNVAIPYFKVPAITKQTLICEVSRSNVLVCFEETEAERCPSLVKMKVPGLDFPVEVGVTCEPNTPDANGECECELS